MPRLANLAWAVVCLVMVIQVASRATFFGLAHVAAEGVFVAGLAALEWRHRRAILEVAGRPSAGAASESVRLAP